MRVVSTLLTKFEIKGLRTKTNNIDRKESRLRVGLQNKVMAQSALL